ncbi:MAG TPA: hypothetical protein VMB49_11360 [Acidobacteriaceae bacterium]|nr:hypothetical protein [Acidobacteriaceae bacterium]
MREQLPIPALEWLSSGSIVIEKPTSVLSTFKPGTVNVVRFTGPHELYRAAGWDAKKVLASAYGSWWADAAVLASIGRQIVQFEGWLPKNLLRKAWPVQYRGAAALCEDWNDMREMFKLELPADQELVGLAGLSAPQPRKSSMDSSLRKTPMLKGGGEQVYFKRTATLNSVNPLWVFPTQLW